MTKPVPAIAELAPVVKDEADVRQCFSAYREAEEQLSKKEEKAKLTAEEARKAQERLEKARATLTERGLALGLALLRVRIAYPERGTGAKGWGEFLQREGIVQSTAWRHMEAARLHKAQNTLAPESDRPDRPFMQGDPVHERPDPEPPMRTSRTLTSPRSFQLKEGFDLRFGRWEDALPGSIGMVDTLVTDPPFGKRTHEGSERATRSDGSSFDGKAPKYEHWTAQHVEDFVKAWSHRVRGWMCCLTSHDLVVPFQDAFERYGRVSFAPVSVVLRGMTCRLQADGPSSWTLYLMVSRPTGALANWGTLDGSYVGSPDPNSAGGRGKPSWLLDRIVADYSRANDLVCDPMAGWGSTLHAALAAGRRCIGAEQDQSAHTQAIESARVPIATQSPT